MGEVYRAHASSPYRSEDLVSTEACSCAEGHRQNLPVRGSRFNSSARLILSEEEIVWLRAFWKAVCQSLSHRQSSGKS